MRAAFPTAESEKKEVSHVVVGCKSLMVSVFGSSIYLEWGHSSLLVLWIQP